MANVLSTEKQTAIISALAEGSSIRSIERITGVHRDTIMRLGVKVGRGALSRKKTKMGRPKLPKGEAMGRIVPVRFAPDDLKAIAAQAKANKQTVSEWIRGTLRAAANA